MSCNQGKRFVIKKFAIERERERESVREIKRNMIERDTQTVAKGRETNR
jgi:hypothetical protein